MTQPRIEGGRLVGRILPLLIVVAAIALVAQALGGHGLREVADRLRSVRSQPLLLAIAIDVLRHVVWAVRLWLLLRFVAPVTWWQTQKALMASLFLTTALPASRPAGGLLRAGSLARRHPGEAGPITAAALVDQVGYGATSAIVGALCLPWAFLPSGMSAGGGRGPLLVGLAITALALAAVFGRAAARTWLMTRIRRRLPAAAGGMAATRTLLSRPTSFILIGGGGAVVWMANAVTLQLAGLATGLDFSFPTALSAWALGSLAGSLTGTPGGMGTTESAAILPLIASGIDAPDALAAVVLARGIAYGMALVPGGAAAADAARPIRVRQLPRLEPPPSRGRSRDGA